MTKTKRLLVVAGGRLGVLRFEALVDAPAISEWGLITIGVLALVIGAMVFRRPRRAAA